MEITRGKILSLLIGIGYMIAAISAYGIRGLSIGVALIFPLALIWFPEEMGNYTGFYRGKYIDTPTPPILITLCGWFFLVGMPLILYFIWRR